MQLKKVEDESQELKQKYEDEMNVRTKLEGKNIAKLARVSVLQSHKIEYKVS